MVVAERVVDLLEAVEVDQHHGEPPHRRGSVERLLRTRSANSSRFGQAREGVVQRLVLVGRRVALDLPDREQRQHEHHNQREVEVGDDDDDRREAQEDRRCQRLEAEVAAKASRNGQVQPQSRGGAGEKVVRDEVGAAGKQDRGQVPGRERRGTDAVGQGRECGEEQAPYRQGDALLADVKAHASGLLRSRTSAISDATPCASIAAGAPAVSINAKTKDDDVVILSS